MSASIPWFRVERHANERIEALRSALETAPLEKIASLQAEIRALRSILALPAAMEIESASSPSINGY